MEPPPSNEGWESGQTIVLTGIDIGSFFAERFRVEEVIGQGAMGKVLRATDMTTGGTVAVKVLHADKAQKSQHLERFRREAEILSNLGHPGIVRILDYGQAPDGTEYLVMELLEGVTLKDHVRERGPMSPAALLPILVTVCDALGAAHQQGIVHRDLKPENVLLYEAEGELRAKIVDFGLGRIATLDRITKTGVMIGTPRYMAPEQIRSAKDADARTDIYACGVLAHEALTGQSPFPAEDAGQLLGCVMENRVLSLDDVRPGLPPQLAPVVRRAMAKAPEDRYATMGGFVEAFAAAIGMRTGRSPLSHPSAIERLFDEAEETDGHLRPLELPRESAPDGPARFTLPAPEPVGPLASVMEPEAARPGQKKRSSLLLGVFLVALVVVACLATAGALALRGIMNAGGPSGLVDAL